MSANMFFTGKRHTEHLIIKVFTVGSLLFGCSSLHTAKFNSEFNSVPLKNSFHGFVVLDAETNKMLYNINGDNYFIPASNVKIVTLFAGTTMLPKQIPTLKYVIRKNTIYVQGTGDPASLHPHLRDSTAVKFLSRFSQVALYLNSKEDRFGPGWAWEDFDAHFSPEKSVLPLYGNVLTVYNNGGLQVEPKLFRDSIHLKKTPKGRREFSNRFYVDPSRSDTLEIPLKITDEITQSLLSRALSKNVLLIDDFPEGEKDILYGIETDSIYRSMMHESDNFLAEQLLMVMSSTLSDTLSTTKSIGHILANELDDLKHPPKWVDGSGLSRYNLFTPESIVQVLQKLYAQLSSERLFGLFPTWDSRALKVWNNMDRPPLVYAKSGSLGNNYNLSGYLVTKSGKVLIFSFMNNHFRVPVAEIKSKIFELLSQLHDKY